MTKYGLSGLIVAMLAGVSAPAAAQDQKALTTADTSRGVQVGIGDCVTQDLSSRDLISTVLTALVSKGVNALGAALTAAGQDKTWKATGWRNIDLGGKNPFPKCIQVIRGTFRTSGPLTAAPGWVSGMNWPADAWKNLNADGLWLPDRPDFFFEGALVPSQDKSAISVRPLFALMNESQGGRAFRGKERGVAVIFAFSAAGANPNLETNPSATVTIGSMVPGQVFRFPADVGAGISTPYDAPWFVLSEADARKPMTVTAMITETQAGSPFFAFVGSIFNTDAVKKDITDRANVLIVPSAGQAAQETQQAGRQTAVSTAETKLGTALGALVACRAASDEERVTKAIAAKSALREYNVAAAQVLPTPAKAVAENVISAINLYKPSELATACGAAYTAITSEPAP
jgi:hypothetical protein